MTLANDSILVTPGSGATVATHAVGNKEHQVVMLADSDGHVHGSLASYMYSVTPAAVGASKLYCDLFNAAGSGKIIDIRGIWVVPKLDAAVVGALGIRIDAYRTSAVGTGGNAAAYKSVTPDVAGGNICPFDTTNANLPAQITARALPAGGATIGHWLYTVHVAGEETATSQAYVAQFWNTVPVLAVGQKLSLREGEGLLLKQGTVAATGSVGFLIVFTVE